MYTYSNHDVYFTYLRILSTIHENENNNTSPMKQTIKHAPSNTSVLIYTRIWDNSKYLC